MTEITQFSPGANVPFDGRGSGYESDSVSQNWALASRGRIQRTKRYVLPGFVWQFGKPPYISCAATGYLAPVSMMAVVDGRHYIPSFAPIPRNSF